MSDSVKEIQTLNAVEMKKLSFITVNGTLYFGKVKIDPETFEIKDAIVVTPQETSITAIVKKWAIAKNKGELRNPNMGGNIAYNEEPLNETQLMELDTEVAKINYALSRALSNIAAGIINEA